MTDDTQLAEIDAQAADARFKDIQDMLEALKDNPEVSDTEAEEHIHEAIAQSAFARGAINSEKNHTD